MFLLIYDFKEISRYVFTKYFFTSNTTYYSVLKIQTLVYKNSYFIKVQMSYFLMEIRVMTAESARITTEVATYIARDCQK